MAATNTWVGNRPVTVPGATDGGTSCSVTVSGATSGRLLVATLSINKSATAITASTGWTVVQSYEGTSVAGAMAWRTASGTSADNITWSWTTSRGAHARVVEYDDFSNPSLSASAKAPSPADNLTYSTTAIDMGSASAAGRAIVIGSMDSNEMSSTPTATNSYSVDYFFTHPTYDTSDDNGGVGELVLSKSVAASGSTSTTVTWNFTDQPFLVGAVFVEGSTSASVSPSTLAVSTTLTTPTVRGGATFTQSALSTTTSLATPTVTVGAGVTTTLAVSTSLPTPTVKGGAAFSQTALSTSTSLPSPTVKGGAGFTQSTLAVSTSLPTPTVTGAAAFTQTPLDTTTALPTPSVGGGASFAQTPLATSTTLTTPTVKGGAGISQATLSVTVSFPTPTITTTTTSPADVTASALAVSTTLTTPTVDGGAGVAQSTLSVTTSLPTPTVAGGSVSTPSSLSVSTSFGSPTVGGGSGVDAAALSVSTSFPTPTIGVGVAVTPTVLSVTTSFSQAGVLIPSTETAVQVNPNRRRRRHRRPLRDNPR